MSSLAENVLAHCIKHGANDAVVSLESCQNSQVKFSNSKIITTEQAVIENLSIFLSVNKRVVVTTLKDISESAAQQAVMNLITFARSLPKNSDYRGIAKGPFKYTPQAPVPKRSETLLDGIEQTAQAIKLSEQQGAARTAGVWEAAHTKVELHTTGGVHASDEGDTFYFSMRAFTKDDASGHSVCSATDLKNLAVEESVREAASIAQQWKNPVRIAPGKYDILFYPLAAANLIDNAMQGSSMFAVEAGLSFFDGKLGKKVASSKLSIADDPTDEQGVGSARFDAEGTPAQRTSIIKGGVLQTFLHNASTARKHKVKSTGNAGLVSPEPFNIVVERGNVNKDTLVPSLERAIVVTNLWYTRFQNSATGDFSTVARDGMFLVENGNIMPVRDARISDNLAAMLTRVDACCRDAKWIVGWEVSIPTKTPSLLIRDVNVSQSSW